MNRAGTGSGLTGIPAAAAFRAAVVMVVPPHMLAASFAVEAAADRAFEGWRACDPILVAYIDVP